METTPITQGGSNNTMLYAGIGAVILIGGVIAAVMLKKPALPATPTKPAATPTKPAATQGAASPSNETLLLSAIPAISNLGASILGMFGSSDDSTT